MSDEAMKALAEKAFEAKRLRRTKLAQLPIERKLEILLDLQRTVNEIARAAGRPTKAEWPREILPRPDAVLSEYARFLEKAGRIDGGLAGRLRAMVGFRNVVVHEYQKLNLDILRAIVESRGADLLAFCTALGLRIQI